MLIGACIPTLFPLVKKIFGASALGVNTPKRSGQKQSGPTIGVATIGSYPKNRRRPKSTLGLTQLDDDEAKSIALAERSLAASTTELRQEDAGPHQRQDPDSRRSKSSNKDDDRPCSPVASERG